MDNPEYQPGASNPAADSEDQWLCFSLAVMSFTLSRAAAPRRNGVEWLEPVEVRWRVLEGHSFKTEHE